MKIHRAIVESIRILPMPAARFLFRVYVKALKTARSEYVAETRFGSRLFCDPRDLIQKMILLFGAWEPNVSNVICRNLEPGDVFVDVGANIGYDTLLASRRVGPQGRVVAIEAAHGTFSELNRNLALNSVGNVRAVNKAVSDHVGTVELYEGSLGNLGAATTVESRAGGPAVESVDASPLELLLTREEMRGVRLIKIDVEGAEPGIMRHVLDQLDLYPPTMDILVEASPQDDPVGWSDIFVQLGAAGFTAYEIDNVYTMDWYVNWRTPTPLRRVVGVPTRQSDLFCTRQVVA